MKKLIKKVSASVAAIALTLACGVTALAASEEEVAAVTAAAESSAAQTRYLITGGIILAVGIVILAVLHFKTKK